MNAERQRIAENTHSPHPWRKWGPYLSERQWGTVREDYSRKGDAWDYFPHDHARSRAYRWGEDGIAGFCDQEQHLCMAIALWNGRDPILKERYFGLTNREGNHGEDVKELYWYLDATPSHSYLKMLYKYPQAAYPYDLLVEENSFRDRRQPEYELLDTGIFDDDRYFDIFVEYAKAGPEEIHLRITACNRGPEMAELHILPQIWFRNTWSWSTTAKRPNIQAENANTLQCTLPDTTAYRVIFEGEPELIFTENETNKERLFGDEKTPGYFKDAFHEYVVNGKRASVNPLREGTKAAGIYRAKIAPGDHHVIQLRLEPVENQSTASSDQTFGQRQIEADEFYAELQKEITDADARLIQRQAFAGMIWSKQFYYYDVPIWLKGDPAQPAPPSERKFGRNREWPHLNNADIISMPDKWEYPWYAAWDLAFHMLPFAVIDPAFAKHQLVLMTREWYMHPNGQIPAYEWNFSDVNPPVHAWATWRVFQIDRKNRGDCGDLEFLERVFHKLMLNFTWWVNRKDTHERNIFQGGFLGLDNIGVFDRNATLPTGGFLNQADGTSWMAMYCLNLMRIALELALHNRVYEDIASKFFEHFLQIAEAMTKYGNTTNHENGDGLWDETDQFFYDEINYADGREVPLKIRSMVGLIPLFAVETLEPELLARLPEFNGRLQWYLENRPELAALVSRWHEPGRGDRRLLSLLRGSRMKKLLKRMLDESEFLSDFGVRSLSKQHLAEPYTFRCDERTLCVQYLPGESDSSIFGGNSNWRGPIWFPVNFLLIESLQKFHHYYGDDFKVECPTGSGIFRTLEEIANDLASRLERLFHRDANGRRPIHGMNEKLQGDPYFRDYIWFHEHFHGDTGRGLGAEHQTGWTGLIAKLLMPRRPESKQLELPPTDCLK